MSTSVFCILAAYRLSDSSLVLVDTVDQTTDKVNSKSRRSRLTSVFFDEAGRYLYYSKDGSAYRFDLELKRSAIIGGAAWSIIPRQGTAILAYSTAKSSVWYLDEELRPMLEIPAQVGLPLTCVWVCDKVFIIGTRESPRFGLYEYPRMEVGLYDFDAGLRVPLYKSPIGEIINVERIVSRVAEKKQNGSLQQ